MTAEAFAEQMIQKHGVPKSEGLYRAILELVFSTGAIHGALNAQQRLTATFRALDAKVPS
jgi:hypothetical protein